MMNNMVCRFINCVLCLLILALVLPCSCIEEEQPSDDVIMLGSRLPDFEVTMDNGEIINGETLRNAPSIVMFFHTSCPDCRQTLPQVQHLYDEYAHRGMQFVLISREEGATSVADYWTKNGLTMPYSAQTDRRIYELFAYRRVPRVYVSDSVGVVQYIFTDAPIPTYDVLNKAVEDVLKLGC